MKSYLNLINYTLFKHTGLSAMYIYILKSEKRRFYKRKAVFNIDTCIFENVIMKELLIAVNIKTFIFYLHIKVKNKYNRNVI